ncbi:helix-turn-helix domain-containing protein [Streptomyces halobius]|uniref:Helix-turn-helix domain-containing protein n=1 Tax=Streptomyces halobius TaxID=2879846 RepID=A0ABY4M9W7_9ACTN|nr:helix-turn-helix domain-containing protein [Streptomyces halobius]UQA93136.1 helix-turn-helix domain-containing protein [Streptomyces halobius]
MYPTPAQAEQMLLPCAHARYVWNLAVEQHSHWKPGREVRTRVRGAVPPAHRSPAR